jgi:hypothetical protein
VESTHLDSEAPCPPSLQIPSPAADARVPLAETKTHEFVHRTACGGGGGGGGGGGIGGGRGGGGGFGDGGGGCAGGEGGGGRGGGAGGPPGDGGGGGGAGDAVTRRSSQSPKSVPSAHAAETLPCPPSWQMPFSASDTSMPPMRV